MGKDITYVGLDAHQRSIRVAMLLSGRGEAVEWEVPHEEGAIRRLGRKLERQGEGEVICCYEAGPCGYALQRRLREQGVRCLVVAPSLVPVKPGQRVKTDRRDARKLAEMLRAGLLTEVHPPTAEEEAVRDLCRCREDGKEDLLRARHRLSKFLLRRGFVYREGKNWTQRHHRWLRGIRFDHEADQAIFDDYLVQVSFQEERVKLVRQKLEEVAEREPYRRPVGWLRCFRGIDTVTALTVVAELHDFRRFHTARQLMGYLGMVPSEHSSGERRQRGGITKTGNAHVRRVLIEAAWHSRHRPAVGRTLRRRREGQPGGVIAIADRAQQRLHKRYIRLLMKGKPHNVVVTAVARELVGFLWAVLHEGQQAA